MARLFIAIDFPDDIREQLSRICFGLPGARWVPGEQLHLTLRFIGEIGTDIARNVFEELQSVEVRSFDMRLRGVGFFPPRGKPRVVWTGVEKNEMLNRLYSRIESAVRRAGITPEKRKFAPHITLARLKNTPTPRIAAFLAENSLFQTREFTVDCFYLYSSILNPKGARHFLEATYPLTGMAGPDPGSRPRPTMKIASGRKE